MERRIRNHCWLFRLEKGKSKVKVDSVDRNNEMFFKIITMSEYLMHENVDKVTYSNLITFAGISIGLCSARVCSCSDRKDVLK